MQSNHAHDVGQIDLRALWLIVWRQKWIVILSTLLFAVAAASASFLVRPIYVAEVLLSPVADATGLSGGVAGAANSPLGGLANLAGVSLGGSDSREVVAIATLQSRALAMDFIRDRDLLPQFFERQWDLARKTWKSTEPAAVPTLWDGERYFSKKVRSVTTDKKSGLVTMQIAWRDPEVATEWANDLVKRTNAVLKAKAADQATRNLRFLEQQLDRTTVIEVRQAIYRLMESEIKTLTLTEGATEYAFKVIDPAVVPHRRVSPNRFLFLAGGIVFGLFVGLAYAFLVAPKPEPAARP